MTLPASGPISMSQVATELGVTSTGINLNQTNVRTLAGRPSGTISMSDLLGKSSAIVFTVVADSRNTHTGFARLSLSGGADYGSCTPSRIGNLEPMYIDFSIAQEDGRLLFGIYMLGNLPQNEFTSVTILGRTFLTNFTNPSDFYWQTNVYATWVWYDVYLPITSGQTFTVTFA